MKKNVVWGRKSPKDILKIKRKSSLTDPTGMPILALLNQRSRKLQNVILSMGEVRAKHRTHFNIPIKMFTVGYYEHANPVSFLTYRVVNY